jgi:hypothetical protein
MSDFEPTRNQFCDALERIQEEITPGQMKMLRAHFLARGHTMSAGELAKKVGYKSYSGTNVQYGTFGSKLREALGLGRAQTQLTVFATIGKPHPDRDYDLTLKREFVEALRELNWFSRPPARPKAR